MSIKKYFWSLNPKALAEVKSILKDPQHPKFIQRLFTLVSRSDNVKEVFSVVRQKDFINTWPRLRRYWAKTNQAPDFKAWWESVYEELLQEKGAKKTPKGKPSQVFYKIGIIFRDKRLKNRISQSDFARRARMSQPDISAIEAGKKNLTLETLVRLCKLLDIKNLPVA